MTTLLYKLKKQNTFGNDLLLGLVTAIFFSAFIYLDHYGFSYKAPNTLFALLALFLLLYAPKRTILFAGFFIGLFWFYWIGYSFEYQNVGYMTPIVTVAFGFIYMLFFGILALTDKVYFRAFILFALSYFQPFDWNWLQMELLFVESYIGIQKEHFAFVLAALSLPNYFSRIYKYVPLLLLILAVDVSPLPQKDANLKIKLVATNITQDEKWLKSSLSPTIKMIYANINDAITKGYDLIVFPESIFPLYMNQNPELIKQLSIASQHIAIVAGSLLKENGASYNVTYYFNKGEYEVAKKLVLVPFGEYIPLPEFARQIINDTFFSSQSDFISAKEPTDFLIRGVKFRNAICYEATCQEIYEGDVEFVIATSNNAWFAPSIEPTLQNLLLRYYARKNAVTIYHAANYKGTAIIK